MLAMTNGMAGNLQVMILAAAMAIKCWPSLLLGSRIVKRLGFASSSCSGVWLVMGVEAKLNFEVSCLDDGFDGSLVLDQVNNTIAVHGFQGPGQVAFFPSRNFCQFFQRAWFLLQDDFQQLLVVVVQDLSHRMQRLKPYLRFIPAGSIFTFGNGNSSLPVFIRGDDSNSDDILFHFSPVHGDCLFELRRLEIVSELQIETRLHGIPLKHNECYSGNLSCHLEPV